jgi:drug/metabolite transporter (DMT)-like permease
MNYLKLLIVSMIWGGTFIAGRLISPDIEPMASSAFRFLIASGVLLISMFWMGGLKPLTLKQGVTICFLGFVGIFMYNVFFFKGLQLIPASRASLIVAINPAMIALASFFFLRERLTLINVFGLILSLVGVSFIVGQGSLVVDGFGLGDLSILMCVVSWVCYTVFSKTISSEIGAFHTVTYSILFGTGLLVMGCWVTGVDMSLKRVSDVDWIAYVYLGGFGSALAYILYYQGIQALGATRSGVFIGLSPLTAVLIGVIWLEETMTVFQIVGGFLVITGVYLCNMKKALRSYTSDVRFDDGRA